MMIYMVPSFHHFVYIYIYMFKPNVRKTCVQNLFTFICNVN